MPPPPQQQTALQCLAEAESELATLEQQVEAIGQRVSVALAEVDGEEALATGRAQLARALAATHALLTGLDEVALGEHHLVLRDEG